MCECYGESNHNAEWKWFQPKQKKNREKIENRFIYIILFVQIIVGSEECSKAKKKKKSNKNQK
jgi:hypothetical protein